LPSFPTRRSSDLRKHAALHAEIDDDHVGTVATEKPVAGGHLACLQHRLNAGIFQHAPQALQHDRMVINDQNARHTGRSSYEKILSGVCTRCYPSCAATVRAFSNIIHVCFVRLLHLSDAKSRQSTCSMSVEALP